MAPRQPGCHAPPRAQLALGFWTGCCTLRAYILRPRLRVACGASKPGYGGSGTRRGEKDVILHGAMAIPHHCPDSKGCCGKERGENTNTCVGRCGNGIGRLCPITVTIYGS
jgi:hypothetical protein